MAKRYVRIGFSPLKEDELSTLGGTVLEALKDNEYFENPVPDLTDVRLELDDFRTKQAITKRKGSPQDTSEKNHAKDVLIDSLKKLAFYVNNTADGELRKLLSSGFPLKAESQELYAPVAPERPKLKDGRQSKQLNFIFDPVKGAWEYEYQYASVEDVDIDGEVFWSELFNTTSSISNVIAPVIPGKAYYARVRARNGRGLSEWAESVSLIAR